ncbi:MAG TPA: hypothetical protein VG032_09940 [Acidimicrobiales bacterium]|jgi:hypothetical protein|nr:hypothetical protein [Acidimicrobiales bacterium]
MAPAPRYRRRASQPELPLPVDDADPVRDSNVVAPPTDWRLDEHTRRVGQQGIAAARAQLAASARVRHGDLPTGGAHQRSERAA